MNALVNLKDTKQSFRSKKIQKENVYGFIFRALNNYVIERYLHHKLHLFNLSVKFNNVREKIKLNNSIPPPNLRAFFKNPSFGPLSREEGMVEL